MPKSPLSKLKEVVDKYYTYFDNANDAIFIADTKTGAIIECNKEAERLLGKSKRDILKMKQWQLHPSEDREYYERKFKFHIQEGHVLDLEAEIVKADGKKVPVSISASIIEFGGRQIIQGIFRDISRLKEAYERLDFYLSLMDRITDGLFIIDIELRRVIYINETAARKFGYDKDEAMTLDIQELADLYKTEQFRAHLAEMNKAEDSKLVFQMSFKDRQNQELTSEVWAHVVELGDRMYYVGLMRQGGSGQ